MKKLIAGISCIALLATGCSSNPSKPAEEVKTSTNYIDLELGKDYTDLTATLTVLTHRLDIIQDTEANTDLPDYVKEFNKLYPNITIIYEGVTDYDFDVESRLKSGDYGDICNIPGGNVTTADLPNYFESFGTVDELSKNYEFVDIKSYNGTVYGLPSLGNAQGIVYNKKVFEKAGITELPKTETEFINALKAIKEKTDAIPLYTNYESGWATLNWDFNALYNAVGSDNYKNEVMTTNTNLFTDKNGGLYKTYKILYDAVNLGLVEEDVHKSSWETCKEMINNGEIGVMVLGSWAISQMQGAGDNADDIGYMPFPITIDGKQYSLAGSDYCYGINKNISDEKKLAAKLFIKFLVEKSTYAYDNSGIPILKGAEYSNIFADFVNVEFLIETPEGEKYATINKNSGLDLSNDPSHLLKLIDDALENRDFDEIMNEWETSWKNAIKE